MCLPAFDGGHDLLDIGAHKFYMGKIGMGILYLLFCWTAIPGILGIIEGIIYLCESDEKFASRLNPAL